ncbi:MAG: flap endonuclease-1 [Candidatus Altiarchaeota archaeon]|nr:flap endonuclease-1 [Candidatus Altiarchaeota archaeon]
MGVNLKDIVDAKQINYADLSGKTVAVDALNSLYQFLASIRQPDGTPLMDSKGNVTSHLSGLLYRTTNLIKFGIKPVYVFDGEPSELKKKTLQKRREAKEEAQKKWEQAKSEGRIDDALKYSKRTSKLTREMGDEAKKLLTYMGVPWTQAPSEGEAQCTHIVLRGDAYAVASTDYDSPLFGAPHLVRGLTMSGKMELSQLDLEDTLKKLELTREQLIDVAILVGTDFDDGVYGLGPKKALKTVKEGGIGELQLDFNLDDIRDVFLNHPVTDEYDINYRKIDEDGLVNLLSNEHDFNIERVKRAATELSKAYRENTQQNISKWF